MSKFLPLKVGPWRAGNVRLSKTWTFEQSQDHWSRLRKVLAKWNATQEPWRQSSGAYDMADTERFIFVEMTPEERGRFITDLDAAGFDVQDDQSAESPDMGPYRTPARESHELLKVFVNEVLTGFKSLNTAGRDGVAGNLRYGDATLAQKNRNILDDEADVDAKVQQDAAALPRAACVLVMNRAGKILAVSGKNDPSDFGLPGGKIDPGEDAATAAARELEEETGLHITDLNQVFEDVDEGGYHVITFTGRVEGQIDTEESGVVRWVDPSVLLAGSFGGYNKRLLRAVGRMK
jgi:ADP-ribose pyrophosphatase YjhB (NUDIX family)